MCVVALKNSCVCVCVCVCVCCVCVLCVLCVLYVYTSIVKADLASIEYPLPLDYRMYVCMYVCMFCMYVFLLLVPMRTRMMNHHN